MMKPDLRALYGAVLLWLCGCARESLPGITEPSLGDVPEQTPLQYSIEAQPIARAVKEWSHTQGNGVLYSFNPEEAEGITSNPVKGRFTTMDALCQLLRGTGYTFFHDYLESPHTPHYSIAKHGMLHKDGELAPELSAVCDTETPRNGRRD